MTMDVSEDVSSEASFRKYVCFGVVVEFSMVFLFGLRSEFFRGVSDKKSLASVAAVQLGVFCDWQEVSV